MSEQAVGVGVIRGVTPDQQLVKVCNPIELMSFTCVDSKIKV